jgi:adenylosuccinate synthase
MLIVLSGEIASGKSTLAQTMSQRGWTVIKTREVIEAMFAQRNGGRAPKDRPEFQAFGDHLDENVPTWLSTAAIAQSLTGANLVIDSVRREDQIESLREVFGRVVHVHLEAEPGSLRERFEKRGDIDNYERIKAQRTEAQVNNLRSIADLVVNTSRSEPRDVEVRLDAFLNRSEVTPCVDVVIGGQYGSEGKGHVVSHIAHEYDALVRVGGPNAGHTVLRPDNGEKVSFYHIPSGALHSPRAILILGPGAVINPKVLEKEAQYLGGLEKLRGRLMIDPQANVISEDDIANEAGLVASVGSTGQGVGVATARKIVERGTRKLARDCEMLKPFMRPSLEILDYAYRTGVRVMLEGTQGTGLSLHHGHYPYVTSRDTTASGTAGEAGIPPRRIRKVIVVVRTNPIRVQSPPGGTSGPMGRETTWEEISKRAGVPADELRLKEMTTTTKRQRRVAEFNWQDLHRATMLNGPTDIALTFVDYIDHANQSARRYEQLTPETLRFIEEVERVAACPVSLITTRFHKRSIIDRRAW